VDTVIGDLRSALRNLLRRPFHAGAAVVVLAVGLTAAMAVFTYLNGYAQPFPGVDSRGLVRLFEVSNEQPYGNLSVPDFLDYAEGATSSFDGLAAAQSAFTASVRLETMTDIVRGQAVSGRFFEVIGVDMSFGRGLEPDDDRPEAPAVAVISHGWWRRRFAADPSILGSIVFLNARPFTVVGVTGPEFLGTTSLFRPDVWIPTEPFKVTYTNWAQQSLDRNATMIRVYGRLRRGVGATQAEAELASLAAGLDHVYPDREAPRRLRVEDATWIDPQARVAELPTTRLMATAAAGLLALVCANVANLLIGIASGRRREMAVRAALGASRSRLLRQVLTENVILAVIAGVVAFLLAGAAASRLGSYFARPSVWGFNVPREVVLDYRVVGFAFLVTIVTGIVAGAWPALGASRRTLVQGIRNDRAATGRGASGFGRRRPAAPDLLIAFQVALSVVLLVTAGLVLRTLVSVVRVDPGFAYEHLVTSYISTSSANVEIADRVRFFRELTDRLVDEPWVEAVTISDNAPLSPHASAAMRIDGRLEPVRLTYSKVLPEFFDTLEIPIRQGRGFERTDEAGAADVAVVNEALARQWFDGGSPLGRHIWWRGDRGTDDRSFEIVGVVGDARTQNLLTDPEPVVYFPLAQQYSAPGNALVVRTKTGAAAAAPALEPWLRAYEPHLAIVNVLPYTDVVRGFLYTQRMNAELFSVIALMGLTLAACGIFSVMSLAVTQQTREIGIRLAIGAGRRDVARLVVVRALTAVTLGLALGLPAAFAATRLVESLLRGVEPTDPVSTGAAVGVLVSAAVAAAYLPARRAARVDPVRALRQD